MEIIPHTSLSFLIANTVFELKIRQKCTFLDCFKYFFCKKSNREKEEMKIKRYYQEINDPFVTREKNSLVKKETFSDEKSPSEENKDKLKEEVKNIKINKLY